MECKQRNRMTGMVAGYHEQYAFFDLKPVKLFEKWFNKSRPQKTKKKQTTKTRLHSVTNLGHIVICHPVSCSKSFTRF